MQRWNRARLQTAAAIVAVFLLGQVIRPAGAADEELTRALAALKAVTKEGKGNEDAGPAWKTLVSQGGTALFPTLEAFDEANPVAMNWLQSAVDAIAEKEKAAGRALPAGQLEAFAKNTKFAPSARRAAYELLLDQDPAAKDRLLPGFINDRSPELRRAAVARELEQLEKASPPTIKADLEKLFANARDKDQVDLLAKKVEEKGGRVSVSEHFGFVTHAALIGPFDSTGGKGFKTAYPPEKAKDASGSFKGKDAEVKWISADTTDKYGKFDLNNLLGKHKDAVAYALAVVVADRETPCDIRVTSATSMKVFLNGKELLGRDEYHHGAPFDADVGQGTLKKGENVIVLKVCQNNQTESWAQAWFFQMRVCDSTGGPLPLKQKVADDKLTPLGYIPESTEKKENTK